MHLKASGNNLHVVQPFRQFPCNHRGRETVHVERPLRVAMCYLHDGSTSGSILRDGCCTVSSWRRQDHNYNFQLGTQDISVAGPDQRWQRGLEIFLHRGVSPAVRCVNSEQPEHEVSRRGHSSTLAHKSCYPTMVGNMFFCLYAAWLNEIAVRAVALLSAIEET